MSLSRRVHGEVVPSFGSIPVMIGSPSVVSGLLPALLRPVGADPRWRRRLRVSGGTSRGGGASECRSCLGDSGIDLTAWPAIVAMSVVVLAGVAGLKFCCRSQRRKSRASRKVMPDFDDMVASGSVANGKFRAGAAKDEKKEDSGPVTRLRMTPKGVIQDSSPVLATAEALSPNGNDKKMVRFDDDEEDQHHPELEQHFQVLGFSEKPSSSEMQSRYRQLALECHPDRNPFNLEEAIKRFEGIQASYRRIQEILDGF